MFKLACETRQTSVLRSLAGSSDLVVRRAVAVNPSTPIEVLIVLWRDPEVRGDVESNPLWGFEPATFTMGDLDGLPSNVVRQLIKHPDPSVRVLAAKAGLGDVTDWLAEPVPSVVAAYAESILLQECPNPAVAVNEALKGCVGKVPEGLDRDKPVLFQSAPTGQSGNFEHLKTKTVAQVPDGVIDRKFANRATPFKGMNPAPVTAEELEVKLAGVVAPEGIRLAGSLDDLWQKDPKNPMNVAVGYKE